MIIIGIDPGSRFTGYGVIQIQGNQSHYMDSGAIRITQSGPGARLQQIYHELQKVVQQYRPCEAAIEQIFMHHNANSALKLGQARGAAIVALDMPIAEYSARQVKQSVVGHGAANKEQVQHMVQRLLNISHALQVDAADALAIALCHAHTRSSVQRFGTAMTSRKRQKNSWRDYRPND